MFALLLELVQKLFYVAVSAQLDVFLPGNQTLTKAASVQSAFFPAAPIQTLISPLCV